MVSMCVSHQCVLCAAPELWYLCGEADDWGQGTKQRVEEQRQAAGHVQHFLQRHIKTTKVPSVSECAAEGI